MRKRPIQINLFSKRLKTGPNQEPQTVIIQHMQFPLLFQKVTFVHPLSKKTLLQLSIQIPIEKRAIKLQKTGEDKKK
ncbi:hypothetical protein FKM82_009314 [Ascaphus truei]